MSLIGWGDLIWEDGTSGSPTWEQCFQALNKGKWLLFQSHTTRSLPEFPAPTFSGGAHHRFMLGAASCPHCRSKLSKAEPLGLGRQIKIVFCWGWCQPSLPEWGKYFTNSLFHNHTTQCPSESWPKPPRETRSKRPTLSSIPSPPNPMELSWSRQGYQDLGEQTKQSLFGTDASQDCRRGAKMAPVPKPQGLMTVRVSA